MKKTVIFILLVTITITVAATTTKVPRNKVSNSRLKETIFKFSFKQIHADPIIKNLDMPGSAGKYGADNICGKIVRVLRYQNITAAVETRYNLPKNILLAMMMEESTGMDLFPNARNDGGAGLIHMQPVVAQDFHLKIYKNCDEMVCTKHGKALRTVIEENNYDRKKMIEHDDRFHPIKNIDAAGRMLACFLQQDQIGDLGPMRSAIRRYAGKWNYRSYWNDVVRNMAYLSNQKTLDEVEMYFNQLNRKLVINDKSANFDEYIRISKQQNYNYGLAEYKLLKLYDVVNSDGGASMYKKYITPARAKLPKSCL